MASKSLGTLTLDLVAKVSGFTQGMDKAERSSAKWRREVQKSMDAAGKAVGAASAIAAGAMAVWVKSSINNAAEIQNLAKVAGASTTEFQKFAAGARTVGIENDKLSDILKDVNDKVGDFLSTGGGELKDFFEQVAPKVGVTAEQFRNLSGPQALGLYVDTLEKAGANQQEMTFFMEAIANDATLLAPLLRNGGKEMRGLADEAQNLGLILSEETIAGAKQFNDDLDLLGRVAGGVGQQIAAELLPDLLNLTNELRKPETAKAAADMAKAVVGSFTTIIDGARNTVQFIQWAAESAAAFMNGIAADDLVRLNDEIERLEQMKASGALDRLVFFGRDGMVSYYNDEELDAELAKLRAAAEAAMQGGKPIALPVEPKLTSGPSAGGPGLNLGGGLSEGARKSADAIAQQVTALERAAKVWGMTSDEIALYDLAAKGATETQLAQAEASIAIVAGLEKQAAAVKALNDAEEDNNREAVSILDSLLSEEDQVRQSYERRRQIILDATLLTAEDRAAALTSLELQLNEDLLAVNGSYWERYMAAAEENLMNFDELSGEMLEGLTGRFGDAFESMVFEAETLGEAFSGLAEGMARSVVNALGEMAAQWLAYQALELAGVTTLTTAKTTSAATVAAAEIAAIGATTAASTAATATTTATQTAAAATTAASWTPAAIAASIGSFGTAAAIGLAAVVAALAFSGGFRKGGYTGGGGVDDVAGVVHGKEFVFDADSTARIGVANLEAMRQGKRLDGVVAGVARESSEGGSGMVVHQNFNVASDVSPQAIEMMMSTARQTLEAVMQDANRNGPIMQTIRRKM